MERNVSSVKHIQTQHSASFGWIGTSKDCDRFFINAYCVLKFLLYMLNWNQWDPSYTKPINLKVEKKNRLKNKDHFIENVKILNCKFHDVRYYPKEFCSRTELCPAHTVLLFKRSLLLFQTEKLYWTAVFFCISSALWEQNPSVSQNDTCASKTRNSTVFIEALHEHSRWKQSLKEDILETKCIKDSLVQKYGDTSWQRCTAQISFLYNFSSLMFFF